MTTANQIALQQLKEQKRSNKAQEKLKDREVKTKEKLPFYNALNKATDVFSGLVSKVNDPSWYNKDKQLVKDVASISYNTPLGSTVQNEAGSRIYPGICAITFMPTIGSNGSEVNSNIANIAAKNIYAYVRYANSGARNYEAPDLMMYLLAIDSLSSFYASLCRIYSVALTSKGYNKYYLDSMLYALGVDSKDIRNNLANLRAYINSYAVRLNSFYVPKDFPIYSRHMWLNTNIFKDQPVRKSQEYIFVQPKFYHLNENKSKLTTTWEGDNATKLNEISIAPGQNMTFAQLTTLGEALMSNLISSEDIGIMSGDILKAYGENNLLYFNSISEDFHIESTYSPEVLSQIQACTLTGASYSSDVFDISQDGKGNIYQGHAYYNYGIGNTTDIQGYGIVATFGQNNLSDTQASVLQNGYHVINMYKDDPTPDDNMVATRLTVGWVTNKSSVPGSSGNQGPRRNFITIYGTEICLTASIINILIDGNPSRTQTFNLLNSYSDIDACAYGVGLLTKFDWFPNVIIGNAKYENASQHYTLDSANYVSISDQVLANMHYVAVLSEFSVPNLGISVRTR